MHFYPTTQEIEEAANLLVNKYDISPNMLGNLYGRENRDQANELMQHLGKGRLDRVTLAKLLISKRGANLFGGGDEDSRKFRRFLLEQLSEDDLIELFEKHFRRENSIKTVGYMITPLVEKRWSAGGTWPRDFVDNLCFPAIFAGVKEDSVKIPSVFDVTPRMPLPELVDFQKGLKNKMLKVLERDGNKTRCIVTLPTGGGKTRVAVEAFIDWLEPRFAEEKFMVWIAQSEELCEQAIQCIKDLWSNREYLYPLRIYRFFGDHEPSLDDLSGGAVVCSIQKLYSRIKKDDFALEWILSKTGAMIIDEAHRAVTDMYNVLFERVRKICGDIPFPICGLTATPGRSGIKSREETAKLVEQFEAYLIKPELGEIYSSNPLRYFREQRFLAHAKHVIFRSEMKYVLRDDEINKDQSSDERLTPGFLKRLAGDKERNLKILECLLEIGPGKPSIVYACTVEHAYFLAAILSQKGRTTGVISSATPTIVRRGLIKEFKQGKIDFLLNFGVLTTGFDAPNTEYIVICRPTTSVILYEQIIGRGLRGPKFGGTEECTIIDFSDNLERLGGPLAYERFSEDWPWDEERFEDGCSSKEIAATLEKRKYDSSVD